MYFQLLKLIIWPKAEAFPPRIVEFKLGMVNVITGASRTGKSAIIPIIDYCLGSTDCFIPIDTIRDHSLWYGIVIQTKDEQILIARYIPDGNKSSNDFYFIRGEILSVPPRILNSNETLEGVKHNLNAISSVPYFSLDSEDNKKSYQARLSFRDLMAFVFQNQDIVANQNILFYKTHAHEHRERLRNWFPFILGAENLDILVARQKIQEIEKKLNILRREFEKVKTISNSWMANMLGHLKVAKEYGLVEEEIDGNTTSVELLAIAKDILSNIPDYSKTNPQNVTQANQEIEALEKDELEISNQIGIVKKRLNDLRGLKSGFVDYGSSVKKRVERLRISQWLKDISLEAELCPACGSNDHPNGKRELEKIATIFSNYENEASLVAQIPTSFIREEERLKADLEALFDRKKAYQNRFDLVTANDKKVQEEFQKRKNMYLFLGHLKSSTETFERLVDGGELQKEIESLQLEYSELQKTTNYASVQSRVDVATMTISQGILNHLKTLDVEDKYRRIAPKFDIKNLNIQVLSNDGNWHFLAEVGSASNWVSFHLALMCSLQEYFIDQLTSSVPSFVIFDQPSQVYFPKLKRQLNSEDEVRFEDEDVEAVKKIFKTIANSIGETNGAWQSIVLDHADDSIYGEIGGVFEVDVWRNGNKLIPEEWYMA